MKNKIVVKVGLVFCVLGFLIMAFPRPSPASLVVTDLVFEGDFQFDRNGMYYVYGIGYPLNVLGHLEVSNNDEKLGDISLNGQKNYPGGEWDGTYFGHWAFDPVGNDCDYEIGIFPDLSQFQEQDENMLGLTLTGFNEVLSIPEELPEIVGLLEGKHFEGSPIPIPTTFLLLSSGLIGLVGLRRRRQ
jgi:hypothetical protein